MIVTTAIQKMTDYYSGNTHDINHFLKVWAFAKNIGELENLDSHTQIILELAAVVHDISCPLCRKKYGNTNGTYQELESPPLVSEFFKDFKIECKDIERISWIVAHHHTYTNVEGIDYQILLEADFLVNADECGYGKQEIESFRKKVFRTKSGTELLDSIYLK